MQRQISLAVAIAVASLMASFDHAAPTQAPGQPPAQDPVKTPDARAILQASSEALARTNGVTYAAAFVGIGDAANFPTYSGHVTLEKLHDPARPPARIAIRGRGSHPGEAEARRFDSAFDGHTVRWLRHGARQYVERAFYPDGPSADDFGQVTRHLGRSGASLICWPFVSATPLANELRAPIVEYQGSIAVGGELCHIIYVESTAEATGRRRMRQWYVSTADSLPRRHETLSIRDGRLSATMLTLSNLQVAEGLDDELFALAIAPGFAVVAFQERESTTEALASGERAPPFALRDPSGKVHRLSELRGQVVVLDFWAEWCVPCKQAMPILQSIHQQYRERGVQVIGVHAFAQPGGKSPVEYVRRMGYSYLHLLDGDTVAEAYQVPALPTLFVIDGAGVVQLSHRGFDEHLASQLTTTLDALLAE